MPKLYEISDELERFLIDCVDKETGEIDENALKDLEALDMEIKTKCLAVAAYMKGELAEANATQAHGDEIQKMAQVHFERAASHRNRAEGWRRYLERYAPHESFSDSRSEFKWRKSTRVEYQEGKELKDVPVKYRRKKTTVTLDKAAAKAVLASGKKIKGLFLDMRDTLTVK